MPAAPSEARNKAASATCSDEGSLCTGATQLTRMPRGDSSTASVRASDAKAALLAA